MKAEFTQWAARVYPCNEDMTLVYMNGAQNLKTNGGIITYALIPDLAFLLEQKNLESSSQTTSRSFNFLFTMYTELKAKLCTWTSA